AKALGIPLGVVGAAFLAVGAHDIYQRKQLEREIIRLNAMIANNDTDDMVKLPAEAPENHSAQLQGLQMEKERLEILLKQEQARNERATASASKLQRDIDSLTQQFLDRDAKCDELYGNLMHQRISLPHRIVIFVIYVCAC
ncbi:MAG: hypothetical protein IKE05_03300, partial [Clostridia bacterium]|nr:hypothetical protein [Clostridia bacterium]